MKCVKGFEVEPHQSAAGYYMGTSDEFGCPNCRISSGYAKTYADAKKLPLDREYAIENKYCNGGTGCFRK